MEASKAMSEPVQGDLTYAIEWINQQFTQLSKNFGSLKECCADAKSNFISVMTEADYPEGSEALIKDLLLDAICTIPGLVFLKHLKLLEEKELVPMLP